MKKKENLALRVLNILNTWLANINFAQFSKYKESCRKERILSAAWKFFQNYWSAILTAVFGKTMKCPTQNSIHKETKDITGKNVNIS